MNVDPLLLNSRNMSNLSMSNPFVVVIPVCNSEFFIEESLLSVLNQRYDGLGVIIRDDISVDGTPTIIEKITGLDGIGRRRGKVQDKDVLFIRNSKKFFGGGNTYDSVMNYVDNSSAIVGVVDGDDWLIDEYAIAKISAVYSERDVWQVWSQHQSKALSFSGDAGYSSHLPDDTRIYSSRNYWSVSHFRTCLAWLYGLIRREDLIDPFDRSPFFRFAGDAANIYPITELCGNSKSYFYKEILYYYNDELSTNEVSVSPEGVQKYSHYIRSMRTYEQLESKPRFLY